MHRTQRRSPESNHVSQPRPLPIHAGCLKFAVIQSGLPAPRLDPPQASRTGSFARPPPRSHALSQLLAPPLASLVRKGPSAGSLVVAASDLSAASLQVPWFCNLATSDPDSVHSRFFFFFLVSLQVKEAYLFFCVCVSRLAREALDLLGERADCYLRFVLEGPL